MQRGFGSIVYDRAARGEHQRNGFARVTRELFQGERVGP